MEFRPEELDHEKEKVDQKNQGLGKGTTHAIARGKIVEGRCGGQLSGFERAGQGLCDFGTEKLAGGNRGRRPWGVLYLAVVGSLACGSVHFHHLVL